MFVYRINFPIIFFLFNVIVLINCEFNLTLLHTNDIHSNILEISRTLGICKPPSPCYGGFARVAYEVNRIKSSIPNTIHLNAGDNYQGSLLYTIFKWRILLPLLQMLRIDAMSLGNHEFDDGIAGLAMYLQTIQIPTVTCNMNTTNELLLTNHTALKPWHMLEVQNVKIAIIGYLTPAIKVKAMDKVIVLDEITTIKRYVKIVKEAGANLIFAVGHSGFEKDKEIAKEIPEVDVVIGGHTHTFMYTGTPPDIEQPHAVYPFIVEQDSGKKVPVVQAYRSAKYLGRLELSWDDNLNLVSATGNPILLDSTIPEDPNVEKEITMWISRLDSSLFERVGASKVYLGGKCRLKECNIGNLITDAIINYVVAESTVNEGWTDAAICILNSGSIASTIDPTDNITRSDLVSIVPHKDQLVRLNIKGSTLLKVLYHSVYKYEETLSHDGLGKFLQFSGLKVEYAQGGNGSLLVKKALVRCRNCTVPTYENIGVNRMYSVVTISYLFKGGDGYSMIKDEATKIHTYGKNIRNILDDYLQRMSPVYPGIEGRIVIPE